MCGPFWLRKPCSSGVQRSVGSEQSFMAKTRDLFDDSVMTFGEHLEVLRVHLFRAVIGLAIGVGLALFVGEQLVAFIRQPIDAALVRNNLIERTTDNVKDFNLGEYLQKDFWDNLKKSFSWSSPTPTAKPPTPADGEAARAVKLELNAAELAAALHLVAPEVYPEPPPGLDGEVITLEARSDAFRTLRKAAEQAVKPVTLNVQEAFMTFLQVGFVAGLVLSSPWVFYQLWLFVAAGLYAHERKLVYIFLPMSLVLFLGGILLCYYGVFPVMLDFLLGYNLRMGLNPQIRISEWISLAVLMPVMFGVSFQLPLVMLALSRLGIFSVDDYRAQWRMAVLVIAVLSAVLTPSPDIMSMMLMFLPLLGLYVMGIWLCVTKLLGGTGGLELAPLPGAPAK